MSGNKEHNFDGPLGECKGCGRYVEECMEHRYCTPKPFKELSDLLINVAQFMDAVKPDLGPEWSDHDQAVRDGVTRHLRIASLCESCGENPADQPSKTCAGCQAYREHQS